MAEEEAIKKIDKKLDTTEDEEITVNLLYKKTDLLEDMLKQNSAELAEKSAEIEKYKDLYNKALADLVKAEKMNMQRDEQIAKYEKIYKEYDCYRWVKELEKKDKIIDLMAKLIDTELSSQRLGIILNKKVEPLQSYKKDIKQYFERKEEWRLRN